MTDTLDPTFDGVATEPPIAGTEQEALIGSLERQRSYIAWKCGGLDADAMRVRLEPSAITLGGLLMHLALVEEDLFSMRLHGRAPRQPWDLVDWSVPDPEWRAGTEDPERALVAWRQAVTRGRADIEEALAVDGLDTPAGTLPDGQVPNLRRLVIDAIEEYARHLGHADLVRESIDGLVGEDPQDAPG